MKIIYVLLIGLSGCIQQHQRIETDLEGTMIPKIDLLLSDSTTHVNMSLVSSGKPIVLFFFAPWCPYCKAQTKELISEINLLYDIDFYLLTSAPFSEFKSFYRQYNLSKFKNVKVGQDKTFSFESYFKTNAVPYFAIYGKDKKLKRVFIGKTKLSLIRTIALQN